MDHKEGGWQADFITITIHLQIEIKNLHHLGYLIIREGPKAHKVHRPWSQCRIKIERGDMHQWEEAAEPER